MRQNNSYAKSEAFIVNSSVLLTLIMLINWGAFAMTPFVAFANESNIGCDRAFATNATLNSTNPFHPQKDASSLFMIQFILAFMNIAGFNQLYYGMAKWFTNRCHAVMHLLWGATAFVGVGFILLGRAASAEAQRSFGFDFCAKGQHLPAPTLTNESTENIWRNLSCAGSLILALVAIRSGYWARNDNDRYNHQHNIKLPGISAFFNCPIRPVNRILEEYIPIQETPLQRFIAGPV